MINGRWMASFIGELTLRKIGRCRRRHKNPLTAEAETHPETELIDTKEAVKHLGIKLDGKLNFWKHFRESADKAANLTIKVSKLMKNIRGPKPKRRRLLMSVIQNILLYGNEI